MAVPVVSLSDAMAERLQELLQRALRVKPSTIDPPLQVSELVSDNEDIIAPVSGDKEIHMNAIESAAKNIFYSSLVSQARAFLSRLLIRYRGQQQSKIPHLSTSGICLIFFNTAATEVCKS
jgi:hypothetical protein